MGTQGKAPSMAKQQIFAPQASEGGAMKFLKDTVAGTCGTMLCSHLPLSSEEGFSHSGRATEKDNVLLHKSSFDAGGIAVTLSGHPFDTVKVRLQTQSSTNPAYCKSLHAMVSLQCN